jgi:tRNA-specific 2-thiouridylase
MTKVFVGMSGGVDSSLTAALLVEQGYDVTGVYMKNWSQDLPGMKCPWADDLADAKRVAVQLGIDFQVYDFEQEYRDKVVQYMIEEYKLGRTPNPDIMCNQEVKFRLFLDAALANGADMIATGHYARVENNAEVAPSEPAGTVISRQTKSLKTSLMPAELGSSLRQSSASKDFSNNFAGLDKAPAGSDGATSRLLMAKDANKDQTYFLYRVTGEALGRTLFPLGGYTKSEVREMAEARGLYTANKKESMGICFVGQIGIREFLGQYVTAKHGDIVDKQSGNVVGTHDGAIFYTLGQRHGLDIGGGLPYYVVGKDMSHNIVYVSQNINDDNIWRRQIELSNIHWVNQSPNDDQLQNLQVRIRHRAPLVNCSIQGVSSLRGDSLNGLKLQLSEPQRAVAAGQSAVLYSGEECLGGGIIA